MSSNRFGNQYNALFIAILAIIILSFSSIWMTWLNIGAKAYGDNVNETLDFTEIVKTDEEYTKYNEKMENSNIDTSKYISKSDYDAILNSYHAMKYAGIIGFVLLGITGVCVFISRKAMTIASLLATLAFAVSMISGMIYCSKTEEYMRDLTRKLLEGLISINYEFKIGIGFIIPLAAAFVVTVLGFYIGKKEKSQSYDMYY